MSGTLRRVAEKIRHEAQEERKRDIEWLMSSPNGRRIFMQLLDDSGIHNIVNDNFEYSAGRASLALGLRAEVSVYAPENMVLAYKEAVEKSLRNREWIDKANNNKE